MYTDTPDPIVAVLTDIARTNFARVILGEISFVLSGFAVGRGGYVHANPVKISALDPSATDLIDQFFPTYGTRKNFELIEYPTPKTAVANCRLASTEAVSALGEIGIWGEIIVSNVLMELNTEFLLGIAHFPIVTKTLRQAIVYRVIIQF